MLIDLIFSALAHLDRLFFFSETVFLGDSMLERDSVIARLIDTCLIINGDTREGHDEALQFAWNEHYVVPINTSGN